MNFKTTLILLLLLVAAGGYVAWDRVRSADKDKVETVATDTKKLFDLKNKDDVTSLTITSDGGNQIVLTKAADNKWRMTKPVEAAAEAWQVDGLVRELVDLESTATVDPKDKGLDKPKFRIEIAAKNG